MKRRGEAGVGKAREPHTVYLRPDLWAALDRHHLELRLNGRVSDSKIEFVEQVLEAGLGALSGEREARRQRTVSPRDGGSREQPPESATKGQAAGGEGSRTDRSNERKDASHTPQRRINPVDRLLQASDPGRPASIRSAANSDEGT